MVFALSIEEDDIHPMPLTTGLFRTHVGRCSSVANIFMFTEPLAGWRKANARTTKTKVDWALEMAELLDTRYRDCEMVTVVSDNLNTHTKGASY
jgi:hypothetical protein